MLIQMRDDTHVDMKYRFRMLVVNVSMFTTYNTLTPERDGRHFEEQILKSMFLNEKVPISMMILLLQ